MRLDRRSVLRALDRHRALLAGGLVAGAVALGLGVVAPASEPVTGVVAAARDLPAGAEVTAADLTTVALPVAVVPSGALRSTAEVAGRVLAGPVRAGEALTDVRLLGAALVAEPGQVAVPVRVAEPALPLLVQAGDRVDVLATPVDAPAAAARAVVTDVAVLAVPGATDSADGALLVVAAGPGAAAELAAAAVSSRLSVVVRAR